MALKDFYQQETGGSFSLMTEYCTQANQGHSLASAQRAVNRIKMQIGWHISASITGCVAKGGTGADLSAYLEGGVIGSINYYYKRGHGDSTITGFVKGGLGLDGRTGGAKCKKSRSNDGRWTKKKLKGGKRVAGGKGSFEVKLLFKEIQPGSNGIDVVATGKISAQLKVAGIRFNIGKKTFGPIYINNIIDPDIMVQQLMDGMN